MGFVLHDLTSSQLSFEWLRGVESRARSTNDFIFFTEEMSRSCLPPMCAIMPSSELLGYTGTLVATSLSTADKVKKCVSCPRKLFFINDLEWLRPSQVVPYRALQALYGCHSLELIARGESHAKLIERCWNRPVKVAGSLSDLLAIAEGGPPCS